jgi:hypothetical protein
VLLRPSSTIALAAAIAGSAACFAEQGSVGDQESNSTTALDRLIIGKAAGYRADPDLRARAAELSASQAERRKTAWSVIQRVIEPIAIDDKGATLPRFQTWYGKDEIVPMFEHILLGQSEADRKAHTPPTPAMVEEAFSFAANRVTTLASFSADRLAARKAELAADGTASLGGQERVLMSPALVAHLLTHYDAMIRCLDAVPDASAPPPSDTNFAPCVGEEFPPDAALVKARWIPITGPIDVYDTSAATLTTKLGAGDWGDPSGKANPDPSSIYTMHVEGGLDSRLVALHMVTKEIRDWYWVSMFWSDAPKTDFGADRPPEITGVWAGYKMCTVVDFDEKDTGAGEQALGTPSASRPSLEPSLAGALAATRAFGSKTWCSNPYLEKGAHNALTNCVGCHQHAGTDLTTDSILSTMPDGSRGRIRENFPADYTFVTTSGLELASRMRDKLNQIVPPPP